MSWPGLAMPSWVPVTRKQVAEPQVACAMGTLMPSHRAVMVPTVVYVDYLMEFPVAFCLKPDAKRLPL